MTGYHVYKEIWRTMTGKVLICPTELSNVADKCTITDRCTIAFVKNESVILHLPQRISKACSIFLIRGGLIHRTVSGNQHYSSNLPQGGPEASFKKFTVE